MDTPLAISALQHFSYCPRQFALIHLEQAWSDNHFTAQGNVLHERVDSQEAETRGAKRSERSVEVRSERLGLHGKLDLLEVFTEGGGVKRYVPVEYKRGKRKVMDWDRIQLCAQALCLEEMRGVQIAEGALWYWQERLREAAKLGFSRVIAPRANAPKKAIEGLQVIGVDRIDQVLDQAWDSA